MKKWIGIAAILICCGIYAMVKLSISQYQDANPQDKETPGAKQTDAGSTDKATPEEDSGSPATLAQVEAVTKVFNEFTSALENEDCEQAWKCMSESFKSRESFEEFKKGMADKLGAVMAEATIRPESATNIGGRVRSLVTHPSLGEEHFFFIQEDGQWKLDP